MTGLPVSIATARLILRPPVAGDLDALYAIATHPAVAPMLLRFSPGMDRAAAAALFPLGRTRPPLRLSVIKDGGVIGSIGMGAGAAPAIYYFLSPGMAGQGLGGEMLRAFLAALDRHLAPPLLTAEVFADNPASLVLLKRNGFVKADERMLVSAARAAPAPGLILKRRAC